MSRPRMLVIALPLLAGTLLAQGAAVDFSLARAYGHYENIGGAAMPINSGVLTLNISSPENTIELKTGSLRLEPSPEGLHRAKLAVTFEGQGSLITEVKLGSFPARFEDEVRVPSQAREVTAWLTIEAAEEGYRVVAEDLPESVEIELESALAGDLVSFCQKMSIFMAGDAGCDGLAHLLEHPRLPLPAPGSEFLVRYSDLTEEERERLDFYLEGTRLTGFHQQ